MKLGKALRKRLGAGVAVEEICVIQCLNAKNWILFQERNNLSFFIASMSSTEIDQICSHDTLMIDL